MKRLLFTIFLLISVSSPIFASARFFSATKPSSQDTINAILVASSKTKARPALLYGLFGQETAYGGYLGKTESEWQNFCSARSTADCFNWKNYDCKADYRNARYFDEILRMLDYARKDVPVSSTCAMGFTQFEPNTWWQVLTGIEQKIYDPWDINDSALMAAYYLQDLGADKNEILGANDVIGSRDRTSLQKYYCGGNYNRSECRAYANGVEAKARRAPVALLQAGLSDQLKVLEEERREIKGQLEKKFIKTSSQYVPPIACDNRTYTIPVQEGEQMTHLNFKERNRDTLETLRSEGLISRVVEVQTFANVRQSAVVPYSYRATYHGGTIIGGEYTTEYEPNLVQWIAFVHLSDLEAVKSRAGVDFKVFPFWENRGPGSAAVEFTCGVDLTRQEIPTESISPVPEAKPIPPEPPKPPPSKFELPPGVNISKNRPNDQSWMPTVLKRRNGDLFVAYLISRTCSIGADIDLCFADNSSEGMWGSISNDQGKSWSDPFFIYSRRPSSPSSYSITEDSNENLILFTEDVLGDKVTLTSQDGRVWGNKREITGVSALNEIPGTIIQAGGGYYYASYIRHPLRDPTITPKVGEPGGFSDILLVRSRDLTNWEAPVLVLTTPGIGHEPYLFEGSDGTIYLFNHSYASDGERSILIFESRDGETWTMARKVDLSGRSSSEIDALEINNQVVFLYKTYDENYYYVVRSRDGWSGPYKLFWSFYASSHDAVLLDDGSLGFVLNKSTPEKLGLDLWFVNFGKLNLLPSL